MSLYGPDTGLLGALGGSARDAFVLGNFLLTLALPDA